MDGVGNSIENWPYLRNGKRLSPTVIIRGYLEERGEVGDPTSADHYRSEKGRRVGEPTWTDHPESGVSSEGRGGRRANFRQPGLNLKGNLKGQFTVC